MPQRHIHITAEAILYALHRLGFPDLEPNDIEVCSVDHNQQLKAIVIGFVGEPRFRRMENGAPWFDQNISSHEIICACPIVEPEKNG